MRQRGLIDINMILDTRLGALARLDVTAAAKLVVTPAYRQRNCDNFGVLTDGIIDQEEYKELYEKYEAETLAESLFTNYVTLARLEVEDIVPTMDIKGLDKTIEYVINVYPYKLYAKEKEVIRRSVARYLSDPAVVKIVDIPWEELTPSVLDTNYDMMVIYNYEDWFKHHLTALKDYPMNEFTVFHPRIAPSGVVPEPVDGLRDVFMVTPMVLLGYIQLHPVASELSCFNHVAYMNAASPGESRPDSEEVPPDEAHRPPE